MTIHPDALAEMKKFFKKLSNVIRDDASFSFMQMKFVNKVRVDDILCCIEANFPDELKRKSTLNSMKFYKELLKIVKHESFFSGNNYAINYSEALKLIDFVVVNFKRDLEYLNDHDTNTF